MKKTTPKRIQVTNRKARFEYHLHDTFEAGMVLSGAEAKSIRQGKVSLQESYCYFAHGELWVKNMHITPYAHAHIEVPVAKRERKLLLKKRELVKLQKRKEKGYTLVPVRLVENERGWFKLTIALAKGKKLYDKRQAIKARDVSRDAARESLGHNR